MSIVIVCNERYAKNWSKALKAELPETDICIYPNVPDLKTVEFAAVWKAPAGVLELFPNLKAIQSLGAGVKHIFDRQKIGASVKIARIVDPQLSEDMWEYSLMLILNHLKNTRTYFQQALNKEWRQRRYRSIKETSVAVMGLGVIGAEIAANLAGLGFQVQGWSISSKEIEGVQSFTGIQGLSDMLAIADVLINVLPLTAETMGILNRSNLLKLKQGAYLINIGRGPHVVDEDLLALLEEGHLSGAALDVFHTEPLPVDHPFWEHPNIAVMPHVAGVTNPKTAVQQIVENFKRMKNGSDLLHVVSPKRKY